MGKFSLQEFFIGMASTIVLFSILGIFGLVLSLFTGILWMLGGTYFKGIRRFGVPAVTFLFMAFFQGFKFHHESLVISGIVIGIIILHQGDGFPDHRLTTQDEGSWLGRLVYKYIDDRDSVGGPITKWIIPILFQVSLIPYFIK